MNWTNDQLTEVANTIRGVSMDAINAANSGHPGLPLGCAEIAAYLMANEIRCNPKDPNWINRDRFVLSAGHGSMVLYAMLLLSGYNISLDDIKNFRQLNSPTAGHPEYGELDGVETTTGPLGQGLATGVGMALGQKMLAEKFGATIFNGRTYILASDGCIMEGITSEASSLAGHLSLDNLVVIYDSNDICLDGPTDECLSEDTQARYESYGWDVQVIDGHSFNMIKQSLDKAKQSKKPVLIIAKTIIGKGSPNLEGSSEVHGKAMGDDETKKTKQALGIPLEPLFHVPDSVTKLFNQKNEQWLDEYTRWTTSFDEWKSNHPNLSKQLDDQLSPLNHQSLKTLIGDAEIAENKATRSQSAQLLQVLSHSIEQIIGGSADLSCSDNTFLSQYSTITASNYNGRNIKYGVREFAMAAMATGLVLSQAFRPYVGTFLMFSDYMRNAIRLAALMNVPVIYQFTHDSVFLGEDGPTHQPVEHLASLRAMPNLTVLRPADENEVKAAWYLALSRQSPSAIVLTRQGIKSLSETSFDHAINGGYVLKETPNADVTLFATGSECSLAMQVSTALDHENISSRVVSLLSWEVFDEQSDEYKHTVIGDSNLNVAIEAQSSFGWERFIGRNGISIGVNSFGKSAPYDDIKETFGFSVDQIIAKIKTKVSSANLVK